MYASKPGPRLLVTDRQSAVYVERARVHVEDGRVVYYRTEDEAQRKFNIPHVNLAVENGGAKLVHGGGGIVLLRAA